MDGEASEVWIIFFLYFNQLYKVRVLLGAHNIRVEDEDGRKEITTMIFLTHPDYDSSLLNNDIALVHLGKPVKFSNSIR